MQGKIQDSGARINYDHGAMREPSTGKGAYELISPFAWERIAIWYELGARKYADRNWEKGIPFGRLIQSAIRHMIRWMKGDRSEDHLAAVCWNVMAMIHFEETGQAEEWNNYPAYRRRPCPDTTSVNPPHPVPPSGANDTGRTIHLPTRATHPSAPPPPAPPIPAKNPGPYHRDYKIIAVDFDGCLCENKWPEIGKPNEAIIRQLLAEREWGAKLILWTCREGKMLAEAVEWCKGFGLEFDAINENLPEMNAMYGNDSRKIGADEYWDDKAVTVKA